MMRGHLGGGRAFAHARPLAGAVGVRQGPNEEQKVGAKTLFLVMPQSHGVGIFGLEHISTHHSSPTLIIFCAPI